MALTLEQFRYEVFRGIMDIPEVLTLNLNSQLFVLDETDPENTNHGKFGIYDDAIRDAIVEYNTLEVIFPKGSTHWLKFSTGTLSWTTDDELRSLIKRLAVIQLISRIMFTQTHNKVTHSDNISTNENDKAMEWAKIRSDLSIEIKRNILNYKQMLNISNWC